MPRLTDEQRRQRKIERTLERFRTLRIHKCINETALLFQKLVRIRAIEPDGKLTCCSCGTRDYPGKHFDAGHWIGRSAKATIFDPRNCHPQCYSCNRFGAMDTRARYDAFMRDRYGVDVMVELMDLSHLVKVWTREELADLYVRFREELTEIERERQ